MDLSKNSHLASEPGNFNACVSQGRPHRLRLPPEIFQILIAMNIRTAEAFYTALYDECMQRQLQRSLEEVAGWNVTNFMTAASMLGCVLDGHVPDGLLYPLGRRATSSLIVHA